MLERHPGPQTGKKKYIKGPLSERDMQPDPQPTMSTSQYRTPSPNVGRMLPPGFTIIPATRRASPIYVHPPSGNTWGQGEGFGYRSASESGRRSHRGRRSQSRPRSTSRVERYRSASEGNRGWWFTSGKVSYPTPSEDVNLTLDIFRAPLVVDHAQRPAKVGSPGVATV